MNLIIALESEAASVWCQKRTAYDFITQNHSEPGLDQTPGTQFIVVDCGGTDYNTDVQTLKLYFTVSILKIINHHLQCCENLYCWFVLDLLTLFQIINKNQYRELNSNYMKFK